MTLKTKKLKKGRTYKGYIREDCEGNYITNGFTPFEDGDKRYRLNNNLNGAFVKITIIETLNNWVK